MYDAQLCGDMYIEGFLNHCCWEHQQTCLALQLLLLLNGKTADMTEGIRLCMCPGARVPHGTADAWQHGNVSMLLHEAFPLAA